MTVLALAELASKKLSQVRAHAEANIEQWHNAIEIVKKAELQAECRIQLPEPLIEQIAVTSGQAKTTDYLTTLEISKEAISGRDEVFKIAAHTLGHEVEARSDVRRTAERDLGLAISQRESRIREAEKRKSALILPSRPEFGSSVKTGCALWIAPFLAGVFLVNIFQHHLMLALLGGVICWLSLPFALVIWPIIARVVWGIRCRSKKNSAEAQYTQELKETEREFLGKKSALQEALDRADSHLQKAKTALDLLNRNE